MHRIVFCDIDGVLADLRHRLHYLAEKDYEKFYGLEMLDDSVIQAGDTLITRMNSTTFSSDTVDIVLLTGRPERTRTATHTWLKSHYLIFDELIMRKDGDYRKSEVIKVEMIRKWMKDHKKDRDFKDYEYWFIDDDPKNCLAVWENFPQITCLTFGADRFMVESE